MVRPVKPRGGRGADRSALDLCADQQAQCFLAGGLEPVLPRLAPVKEPKHQNRVAIVPVLQGVCATEHLEEELAVFLAARD